MQIDMSGLDNIIWRVKRLTTLDATPLMVTWQQIVIKDNRRGVLAGLDKDGVPMKPVTYRPVGKAKKLTLAQKNTDNPRQRKGVFGGFGPMASGLHNNLSSSEYRKLDGPPLAPRREFSRVITNLQPGWVEGNAGLSRWVAVCAWIDVVSRDGEEFLPVHFKGEPLGKNGPRKQRDLRGVRPAGLMEARRAMIAFWSDAIRNERNSSYTGAA